MKRLALSGSILIILLMLDSCAKNPVTGKTEFMLVSKEQEIAMGRKADPQIVAFFGLYQDEQLQNFMDEKGEAMAEISHRPDLPYEFKIVDSPVVNAFAVPGGFVYFTRGIMAHFNNEAQFAGVLGHEIGHITARHSAKQYTNAMLGQLGLVAGTIIAPEFAQFADIAQTGLQLLFLKFGRDAESQSDKLGVQYSTKIGYDASEMAEFFATLDRLSSEGEEVPTFLSTHPDPEDREERVVKLAEKWQRKTDATDLEVGRESYLRMIDGLVYGEDPKQGFVENNVFYHPVLRFQFSFPASWSLQNTPQQVQIVPRDGRAVMLLRLAKGNSLEAAAETALQNYQLTLVDSKQQTVNGLPAIVLVADQNPQQQQAPQQVAPQGLRVLMYFIQYGENIYSLIGASTQSNFDAYAQLFQSTMSSFRELSDPSKINKEAEHIRVKPVPQNGTLSQTFSSLGVPQDRLEELAVLNGMTLNDQVQRGMLIKVID